MEPVKARPPVRRHDSITQAVRRVFQKLGGSGGAGSSETEPGAGVDNRSPPSKSPPDTPTLGHARPALHSPAPAASSTPPHSSPLSVASPTSSSRSSKVPEVSSPSPSSTPTTPSAATHERAPSGWRNKGSTKKATTPNTPTSASRSLTRGWLKVSVGGMRDLVWADSNHLPTLFVVLEMDAQVFRSRYQARSVTPVWNDNFIMAIASDSNSDGSGGQDNSSANNSNAASEDLDDDDERMCSSGLLFKVFHRSSPVSKLLLGTCQLSRKEAISFIAPTTLWLSLHRSEFDRGSGKRTMRGAIIGEIQICLQFMAQEDNGVGKREEQLKLHLQREWVLAQSVLDQTEEEFECDTVWVRHETSEISSHPGLEDDLTLDVDVDVSEYADGGYAGAVADGYTPAIHLSGSGDSWSEDTNHYIRPTKAAQKLFPRPLTSLPHPPVRIDLGDFNARFQDVVDRMGAANVSGSSLADRLTLNTNLVDLAADFLYSATSYGKIIVSEYNVPDHSKTIKPIGMGGILGGPKYLFATDESGLFGSHQASAKVAGNELRGNIAYYSTGVEGLHFPLMALLDYKGFRLVCSSYLPINRDTLVYGTSNAGKTLVNKSPELYEAVKLVLNLKPHAVGDRDATWQIYSPADLEGHQGTDGRHYLLDFSRHMPPIRAPKGAVGWEQQKNTHLYRLLRPEFVQQYDKPLCADAFSGFMDEMDENCKEDHQEVKDATRVLLSVTIPAFARQLCRLLAEEGRLAADGNIARFRLTEALHRGGINLCFLGKLHESSLLSKLMPDARDLVLIEALSRVIKNVLRWKLRERVRELTTPLQLPYHYLVAAFLNDVFGNHDANQTTQMYWKTLFPQKLMEDFCFRTPVDLYRKVRQIVFFPSRRMMRSSSTSIDDALPLRTSADSTAPASPQAPHPPRTGGITGFFLILERVITMMGLVFNPKTLVDLAKNPQLFGGSNPIFDSSDVLNLGERVKHLNVVSFAKGYVSIYKGHKASYAKDYISCIRYYEQALVAYQSALDSSPNDPSLLRSCAKVYLELEKAVTSRDGLARRRLRDSPYLIRADFFYRQSLEHNNGAPEATALAEYGSFLEHCREFDAAETFYLKALTLDPNHVGALKLYATFLQEVRQSISLGDRFLARYRENARALAALKGEEEIVVTADLPSRPEPHLRPQLRGDVQYTRGNRPRSMSQNQLASSDVPLRQNTHARRLSVDDARNSNNASAVVAPPVSNGAGVGAAPTAVAPAAVQSANDRQSGAARPSRGRSRSSSLSDPEPSQVAASSVRIVVAAAGETEIAM